LGIADHVGRAESETARNEIVTMVAELEYETEWEIVFQQKGSWSTVKEMSTSTHPKARIIERAIRPEKEPAFDAALSKWTAFLVNHRYPLPVEGFVLRSGATGTALQVVFPTDWSSYHGTDSFSAFTATLDARAQRQFADREAALMATVVSVEHYDGDFAPELSFQSR